MSSNSAAAVDATQAGWSSVCGIEDILPDAGACALVDGKQIAIFRIEAVVYAIDNYDPGQRGEMCCRAESWGDLKGERVVASPLYKHHYSLVTGRCLEDSAKSVNVYPVRVLDGRIWVNTEPQRQPAIARRRQLVVIGNGMAGMRAVEELLQLAPDAYEITVFGAEPHVNYNRILLSPVLAGEKHADDIVLNTVEWYAEHRITLHIGDPVVEIARHPPHRALACRRRSTLRPAADRDRLRIRWCCRFPAKSCPVS